MKRFRLPTAALLVVASMPILSGGCSQLMDTLSGKPTTPQTRVAQLRVDYTAALKVLVQARMLGKIDDAQYRQIELSRVQAATALDTLEAAAMSGQPLDASLMNQAQTGVDALIAAKAAHQ